MNLTNGERGDVIDALKLAAQSLHGFADGVTIAMDPDTAATYRLENVRYMKNGLVEIPEPPVGTPPLPPEEIPF